MTKLGQELKEEIMKAVDLSRELSDEELLDMIDHTLQLRGKERYLGIKERLRLRREIFNSIRRLDILQELVEDAEITEIMINGASRIFIEKAGRIEEWDRQFESERKLFDIIQQIVSGANRVINETNPIVDARLYDGSRVNIVLPPVSLTGPVVTIRKFPKKPMTMEKLISYGSISGEAAEFLKELVEAGYNIFISGGTGAGKTTFLNALSGYIPSNER
ncbi:MAG TPA: CpaF family protein, partial [Candidatus Caccomorpha excrementavium]|nr:CpaF family protein [Candidatus Caccomorpha excrementavium]